MSHREDFIPRKDEDFDGFQSQFMSAIALNMVAWGLTITADYTALVAAQTDWVAKYAAGKKSALPTHPQVVAKQTSRHDFEKKIRVYNKRYLVANASISDADRATLGTTIDDTVRTRSHAPGYAPVGSVNKISHELHTLRIVDPTHPDTREMPDGAVGANVFVSITPPPAGASVPDPSTFYFLGTAHKFEYDAPWASGQAGKTAYYFSRYIDIHGGASPDSAVFSAVIA